MTDALEDPSFTEAVKELESWVSGPLTLAKPSGSQLHSLLDDWRKKKLPRPTMSGSDPVQDFDAHCARLLSGDFNVFLIEHDWASAFANAEDFAPSPDLGLTRAFDFRGPYPDCCYEFQISGRRVCLLDHFDGDNHRIAAFVHFRAGWLQPPLKWAEFAPLARVLDAQFRAVGIALEAKVAETEAVRAPEKLNRARERRNKVPVFSHHIVRLARSRPSPLPRDGELDVGRRVRLHFRRGHWRHYDSHKTWINWMLVGDPDLGFIEKQYRL